MLYIRLTAFISSNPIAIPINTKVNGFLKVFLHRSLESIVCVVKKYNGAKPLIPEKRIERKKEPPRCTFDTMGERRNDKTICSCCCCCCCTPSTQQKIYLSPHTLTKCVNKNKTIINQNDTDIRNTHTSPIGSELLSTVS